MKLNFSLPIEETIHDLFQGKQTIVRGEVDIKATYFPGAGEDEPDIDYTFIKWRGVDLLPLLDNLTAADELMSYFYTKTLEAARNKQVNKPFSFIKRLFR